MAKNTTTGVTSESEGRRGRLLDGVGIAGTVFVGLVLLVWSLASNWVIGGSWSGALGCVIIAVFASLLGYRRRAAWHARRLRQRSQVVPLTGQRDHKS